MERLSTPLQETVTANRNRYVVRTLGCKANLADSQQIEHELQKRGWVAAGPPGILGPEESQKGPVRLCIVNSCTVTDEADRQSRKTAKKLAREFPDAAIVVTGCAAEVDPDGLADSPGIHYVVGNQNKEDLVELVLKQMPDFITSDILKPSETSSTSSKTTSKPKAEILGTVENYETLLSRHPMDREWPTIHDSFHTPPTLLQGQTAKTRAFLKIQEGCNSFCTYCIIPYGRGPSRSLEPKALVKQVQELVAENIQEIVLTGTNIGDYGTDWGGKPQLEALLETILSETSIKRLRVSSLDPTEITPQMISLMSENPRFCAHFHVSLQSPHSRILKLMKRRYGFEKVKECLEAIARIPAVAGGAFVGMDVITGFPGETEDEFEWGYQALSALPWTRLHVFPYSERSGTPATRLPGSVPQHIRVRRSKKLNLLSMERLRNHYRAVLESFRATDAKLNDVLLERKGQGTWTAGYTPNYLRVLVSGKAPGERNEIVSVRPIDLMIDTQAGDVAFVSEAIDY